MRKISDSLSQEQLFSKIVKHKQKAFYFDIQKGKGKDRVLSIMFQKDSSENKESFMTLKKEEVDILLSALTELKPILHESYL